MNETYQIKDRFRGFLPVVVDVETGGFDPERNPLLEVAMMTITMDSRGFFSPRELLSANIRPFPGSVLNESNISFLGIDPYDESRELHDEQEILPGMFKAIHREIRACHCRRAVLVGHNAHFDLSFVLAAARRSGLAHKCPFHPFTVLDTASFSALVYGQTVLSRCCAAAGLTFDEECAHGAAYDTVMECKLFCAAMNRFTTFAGVPEKLSENTANTAEIPQKHHDNAADTPLPASGTPQPGAAAGAATASPAVASANTAATACAGTAAEAGTAADKVS